MLVNYVLCLKAATAGHLAIPAGLDPLGCLSPTTCIIYQCRLCNLSSYLTLSKRMGKPTNHHMLDFTVSVSDGSLKLASGTPPYGKTRQGLHTGDELEKLKHGAVKTQKS